MAPKIRFHLEYSKRDCYCKRCGALMSKGGFRVLFLAGTAYGITNQYYHPECIFLIFTDKKKIKITSEADIEGWNDVKKSDADAMRKLIKKHCSTAKTEAESKGKQAAAPKKRGAKKPAQEEDEDEDTEENSSPPKAKKAKKAAQAKPAAKKGSATKTAAAAPAAITASPAPAATPAKTAAANKSASPKKKTELDDEAVREFRRLAALGRKGGNVTAELSQFSVADLKFVLKLNDRSTTGNKTDLTKAVADCMKHGCPPRCPECGGGRLRVKPDGSFYCPGYMEDDEFQHCAFKAAKGGVIRIPWKDPSC